jgi:hypothetical protein
MTDRPPRVGVIGARRRRQGVGDHLARFVHEAGGVVVAVAGTSPQTVEEARAGLAKWGIDARGHVGAEAMLEAEDLDALVIASPAPLHERHLRLALDARLHVLCEKPLIWRRTPFAADAAALVEAFRSRDRHLAMNVQWARVYRDYIALFPDPAIVRGPFRMRLSPSSTGYEMLVDAIAHPLSLLETIGDAGIPGILDSDRLDIVGSPEGRRIRDVRREEPLRDVRIEGGERRIEVTFGYPLPSFDMDCRVTLETCAEQPRPASIELGDRGFVAHRVIRDPGYRLSFRDERSGREVPFEDPMRRATWEFVATVATGLLPGRGPLLARQTRFFEQILSAWEGPVGVVAGEEGG